MSDQSQLFGEPVRPVTATKSFLLGGYRPESHARSTDPSTSARAAEAITYKVGTAKARLLAEYRNHPMGLTDDEAAAAAGLPAGAWKRCSDLRADGAIVPVGEKMGRHGTPVRICAATTEGEGTA